MTKQYKTIEGVSVIDLGDKGSTIAQTPDGEIILIQEKAVPGDIVDVKWKRKKKGLKLAYPTFWKSYSPDRTAPFCEHFEFCGGCNWQNLSYNGQLKFKEKKVRDNIVRIAKDDGTKVNTIVPSIHTKEYRNKMEYSFSSARWLTPSEIESGQRFSDRRALGFHIAGSFDKILDIKACHLQDSFGNILRNSLRDFAIKHDYSFYDIRARTGLLRNLILRNSSVDEWMVVIVFAEDDKEKREHIFSWMMSEFSGVDSWYYIINKKANSSVSDLSAILFAGKNEIYEQLGTLKFQISPLSFFQTNSIQAVVLYNLVKKVADLKKTDTVYDLYSGTGSIALFLADSCKHVIGIEEISAAIHDAEANARRNQIDNVSFLVGDVRDVLNADFQIVHGRPDVIISDPPRSGMHKTVIETLIALGANRLVYISCNPATQARDILLLKEAYDLKAVFPVDMFPQTSHIESVALLELK